MFVTPRGLFMISIWKLAKQDFYSQFPISLDRPFEYAILAPNPGFNLQ